MAYIKTFSTAFQEEKPGEPVEIPPEPANSADSIKRGADLFQSMNCWRCHGKAGAVTGHQLRHSQTTREIRLRPSISRLEGNSNAVSPTRICSRSRHRP